MSTPFTKTRSRNSLVAIGAAVALSAAVAGAAVAGPRGDDPFAPDRVDAHLERMTERLDLSDAQIEDIRAMLDTHHEAADRERAQLREQIDTVLTDEQRALRDERKQAGMERRLERMAGKLDLTDAQRDEVQAIMEEKRTNPQLTRAEIRERVAAVLTDEQRDQLAQMRGRHSGGPGRDGGRFGVTR